MAAAQRPLHELFFLLHFIKIKEKRGSDPSGLPSKVVTDEEEIQYVIKKIRQVPYRNGQLEKKSKISGCFVCIYVLGMIGWMPEDDLSVHTLCLFFL